MRRVLAVAIVVGATLALETAGCEVLVPAGLPSFTCVPGQPNTCPSGQVCSLAGVCTGACPKTPCPTNAVCDEPTKLCVSTGDTQDGATTDADTSDVGNDGTSADGSTGGDVGASCQTQSSCKAGLFCADTSALTAEVVRNTGSVCTKTCCRSEDCPADFACYSPGTGGNYCVRASELPRLSADGSKPGGSECSSPQECRSGICIEASSTEVKRCADTCCVESDCPGGGVCGLANIEGHFTMACTEAAGRASTGEFCSTSLSAPSSEICENGLCGTQSKRCLARCCGKGSCGAAGAACGYLPSNGPGVTEYIPACSSGAAGNGGRVGDACTDTTSGTDCVTGFCEAYTKKCTDVCCTDSDCQDYPGYTACRPDTNPSRHVLICSPAPPT
jgi:hypothetical protein